MPTETASLELTEVQWQVAHAIARQLVIEGSAGKAFFDYLKTLVRRGNQIGHSKQTVSYYKSLDAACEKYLKDYQDKAPQMLMILGWAARLVQYYNKGVPTGEIQQIEVMSEREAEIQAVTQAQAFEVGQEIEATVAAIKGNKVTYEILGTIRLTQKEPKLAGKLTEGQIIIVRIEDLRDDKSIKRVKGIQR